MKGIDFKNVRDYAYCNSHLIKGDVKGVIVHFFGLGQMTMYSEDSEKASQPEKAAQFAESGILCVIPYTNPWAWMNPNTVAYTDEILDVLYDGLNIPQTAPAVYSGGSMGGQQALMFTLKAKRKPVACVINCPAVDMVYHYNERPDCPRTIYSACMGYNGTLDEAVRSISPMHHIDEMPKIKYGVFCCDADEVVDMHAHGETFVEKMRKAGHDIFLNVSHNRGHCQLDPEAHELYWKTCADAILK